MSGVAVGAGDPAALALELAELLRRWVWVFFRVEWECVRKMGEREEYAMYGEDAVDGIEVRSDSQLEGVRIDGDRSDIGDGEIMFDAERKNERDPP